MKSTEKELAIKLRNDGRSVRSIAKEVGVSKGTVSLWVRGVVLTDLQKEKLCRTNMSMSFDHQQATTLFNENLSYDKIAKILNIKKSTLRAWFNLNGLMRKKQSFACCCGCGKKNTRVQSRYCNTCYTTIRRYANKIKAVRSLGGRCSSCGIVYENTKLSAYEFHHKKPNEKEFNFSVYGNLRWDAIKKELEKCVLLCSSCHRLEHSKMNNNEFLLQEAIKIADK